MLPELRRQSGAIATPTAGPAAHVDAVERFSTRLSNSELAAEFDSSKGRALSADALAGTWLLTERVEGNGAHADVSPTRRESLVFMNYKRETSVDVEVNTSYFDGKFQSPSSMTSQAPRPEPETPFRCALGADVVRFEAAGTYSTREGDYVGGQWMPSPASARTTEDYVCKLLGDLVCRIHRTARGVAQAATDKPKQDYTSFRIFAKQPAHPF
jgi:hypothetical protein